MLLLIYDLRKINFTHKLNNYLSFQNSNMELSWLYTLLPLFLIFLTLNFFTKRKLKLPPSPFPSIPLIGHLFHLKPPIHRTYHHLAQKLGPIFSLQVGNRLMVVVSSPSLVEECFTKNDIILANRPRFALAKYITYNYTILTASPYGDHWRNLRRLTTVEVFSSTRVNVFQSIREDEVRIQLQKMYKNLHHHDFTQVQIRNTLSEITFNNIMRMVAGKRYYGVIEENEKAKNFQELIDKIFMSDASPNLVEFFPVLGWIDYKGYDKNLAKFGGKMDAFLQNLIDEHIGKKGTNTMIDHLLSLQESQPEYYSDTTIKGIIMALLLAGTDTSSKTIEWALAALLNHPEKLQRVRSEIDHLVGSDRLINESDLSNLPYLNHIISETLRLFPPAPLLLPHEASSDCKIGGYDIPRGTIILPNAWAIHRDPTVWDEPTSFWPERFEVGGEVGTGKLLPFGLGRRSCPGIVMAQRVVGLTLGSLLQGFEWRRIGENLIDLESTTMINVPLEAECKVRDVLKKVFK